MKTNIRRKLSLLQARIGRRIAKENKLSHDDGQPVLRGTSATYDISTRTRAVASGGIALIHYMVQALGLDREIDDRVKLLKYHQPYHESDHVMNIAFNQLAGGECLEDLELLRNDENYLDMLGARRIPDPTTAGDFCRRFESAEMIDQLQDAINEARIRVWEQQPDDFFDHAIIDADGTYVDTSECTEGANFGHKGFGFHPLVVTLANTQETLSLNNRPGSQQSHEGAASRLDEALELIRRAGFRRVTLRGDTDFSQTTYLDGWDDDGVSFVFGYGAYENIVAIADSLQEGEWSPLEREGYEIKTAPRARPVNVREECVIEREFRNIQLEEEHYSEFPYRPTKCGREYRMVVVRKRLNIMKGQKLLFPEVRYFFYITNMRDISAREVVKHSNLRCDQERVIGQLKSEVRSLRAPLDNLHSNWAYMVMTTLAWNLSNWFALLLPAQGRWKEKHAAEKQTVLRMNFGTFVRAFMLVPAQVIRGARRVTLRLLSWNPWQRVFFRSLDAIRLMT